MSDTSAASVAPASPAPVAAGSPPASASSPSPAGPAGQGPGSSSTSPVVQQATPGPAGAGVPASPAAGGTSPGPSSAGTPAEAPKQTQVAAPQAQQALNNVFAQVKDPAPPKEYTPDAWSRYQSELQHAEGLRQFQRSVVEVVTKPTTFSDGVSYAFSSPEEVGEFASFIRDVSTNQRPLTGKDLLLLFRAERLFAAARDHGSRQYEAGVKGTRPAAPASQAVVPKPEPQQQSNDGRVPSVRTLLQQKDPDFYNKLMKGEVSLT